MTTRVSTTLHLSVLLIPLVLSACSSTSPSDRYQRERYSLKKDAYPDQKLNAHEIADAVPQKVVRTKAGNKTPYTVLGKTYHVMEDPGGFSETGDASWYGIKFHGHRTSNGEIYNMYDMTAAHKTLPIPTYVRVTNLENDLSTVVRVNDRGPFHDGRIIDLSYAAATKLGYAHKGTAPVKIEVLEAGEEYRVVEANVQPAKVDTAPAVKAIKVQAPAIGGDEQNYQLPGNTYLQVAAFSNRTSAENALQQLRAITDLPVLVREKNHLFKVQVGPIIDNFDLLQLRELVIARELGNPVVVYD